MQGVAGFEYNGRQKEQEEGLGREPFVEGEVLMSDHWEDCVVEYTHYESCRWGEKA